MSQCSWHLHTLFHVVAELKHSHVICPAPSLSGIASRCFGLLHIPHLWQTIKLNSSTSPSLSPMLSYSFWILVSCCLTGILISLFSEGSSQHHASHPSYIAKKSISGYCLPLCMYTQQSNIPINQWPKTSTQYFDSYTDPIFLVPWAPLSSFKPPSTLTDPALRPRADEWWSCWSTWNLWPAAVRRIVDLDDTLIW